MNKITTIHQTGTLNYNFNFLYNLIWDENSIESTGMHGLNEELVRHVEGGKVRRNVFCVGSECDNVSHVLWECSAYTVAVKKCFPN